MSIPIEVNRREYERIKKVLQTKDEVVCLTKDIHILYTLVALDLLKSGQDVKAQIKQGY